MFGNGSTAIDGLSGSGKGAERAAWRLVSPIATRYTRTGRAMFLTCCSPRSSKAEIELVAHLIAHDPAERRSRPGSARASSRAAILTPSPKMSSSSTMTSPRLIPTRNSIRCSAGAAALRSTIPRCTSTAQRTASTTLANSAKKPSPVFFTIRPRCSVIFGSTSSREMRLEPFVRPLLIRAHQARIARHVGGEDRGEAADRGHFSPGGRLA